MAQADLEDFFGEYSERMNRGLLAEAQVDAEGTAAAFAECFIEAGPQGVSCAKNDAAFLAAIPKGLEFYRSIGTRSMRVTAIEGGEIREGHYMARVYWQADYIRKDGSELSLEFDVVYLLQLRVDGLKIFGYITGDEQQAYQDAGLI